jgi:AcrR family transcriptional regulator
MIAKKLNKHEIKTKETRELLLQAAETIFVRDGYEGAELGEIATLAGRTKGAIYAQFKSKEDIFLALIEEKTKRYRTQMEKMLTESTSQEENLAAFRQFCLGLTEDQA